VCRVTARLNNVLSRSLGVGIHLGKVKIACLPVAQLWQTICECLRTERSLKKSNVAVKPSRLSGDAALASEAQAIYHSLKVLNIFGRQYPFIQRQYSNPSAYVSVTLILMLT
jgi:hypothetical protein